MNLSEFYNHFTNSLATIYESREAENISDWVFENITGLKKWERRTNRTTELDLVVQNELDQVLSELMTHKPVQYILNEAWFYKRKFYVNENVLIPRPETEELVEWVITDSKQNKEPGTINILDIGTGSGCIAISLKKELPVAGVMAIDVSEKALEVAKKNALLLDAYLEFLHCDFLQAFPLNSTFEVIVSNPPYIPENEKEMLDKNVTKYEPSTALFVEENDPLIFYKAIADFAKTHLKEQGKIYVEVHENFAGAVQVLFENKNYSAEIKTDIYGKERMVRAEKKA